MLKRLLKVSMLACALTAACSAFAQDETQTIQRPDFPRVGFWSNWSVGAEAGASLQAGIEGIEQSNQWGLGANLVFAKQLNYDWAFRIKAGMPRFYSFSELPTGTLTTIDGVVYNYADVYDYSNGKNKYGGPYGKLTLGFTHSLIGACRGYNPDRKGDFYVLADAGVAFENKAYNGQTIYDHNYTTEFGHTTLIADFGIGASCKVGEKSSIYAESYVDIISDLQNPAYSSWFGGEGYRPYGHDLFLCLGYMHNFGLTATDAELIAQKEKLTQENFDALNNQVGELEKDLADAKKAEQKLENRINELEAQNEKLGNYPDLRPTVDSLQNIINNIKADQLKYYALPLSILYPNDVWTIPADQNDKVKAVVKIMKDDPNIKFKVVSFCSAPASNEYNMKLSQKRAEEVIRVLTKKYGIDADRLSCDWKGEEEPFGDPNSYINRRSSFYRVIE